MKSVVKVKGDVFVHLITFPVVKLFGDQRRVCAAS